MNKNKNNELPGLAQLSQKRHIHIYTLKGELCYYFPTTTPVFPLRLLIKLVAITPLTIPAPSKRAPPTSSRLLTWK